MDVKGIYYAGGLPYVVNALKKDRTSQLIKFACALCNDVVFYEKIEQANSVDKALITFAVKNGIDLKELLLHSNRIYDKPFDSENRHMVCGYELKDLGVCYFVKGDPDVVLRMCDSYLTQSGNKKIDLDFWFLNNNNIGSINKRGNTAIALAYVSGISDTPMPSQKYTFLCILELENSLQHEAREIIKKITARRIRSIMLTGDRAETAENISKQCGITKGSEGCLTGRVIERMALSEVSRQSVHCSVFARLLPSQKGVIIRLFQQKGYRVVMIGDGPNDAIALNVADIGISFTKNSSPIARRLSKILIAELSDLLRLIEGTNRISKTLKYLKLFRILILTMILFYLYLSIIGINGLFT